MKFCRPTVRMRTLIGRCITLDQFSDVLRFTVKFDIITSCSFMIMTSLYDDILAKLGLFLRRKLEQLPVGRDFPGFKQINPSSPPIQTPQISAMKKQTNDNFRTRSGLDEEC